MTMEKVTPIIHNSLIGITFFQSINHGFQNRQSTSFLENVLTIFNKKLIMCIDLGMNIGSYEKGDNITIYLSYSNGFPYLAHRNCRS